MRIRSVFKHSAQAIAEAGLISLLVVGLMAGTAVAGKGGSSASLAVVPLNSTDGMAHHGSQVTFNVTTSNAYPVVSLTCKQSGTVVYGASEPMYWPNIWDSTGVFTLSSIAWSAGAGDCTAALKGTSHGKVVTLATTTFHVEA
jgi:hypothetical protein